MKNIPGSEDWHALCEQASKEQDPEKLLDLIAKINQALEERNRQSHTDRTPIKISHVLLPATIVKPEVVRPGIALEQAQFEQDCWPQARNF